MIESGPGLDDSDGVGVTVASLASEAVTFEPNRAGEGQVTIVDVLTVSALQYGLQSKEHTRWRLR